MASKITSISPTCHTHNIEPAMLPGAKLRPNRKARCHCGEANMKRNPTAAVTVITLLAALALPVPLAAQHTRYKLIDLGTLGGPVSTITEFEQWLLNDGTLTGIADTSIPDPYAPNCFDPECLVQHAFEWQDGVFADLGALPGGSSSVSNWIN